MWVAFSCIKYLLGNFCFFSDPIRFESGLVGTQCNFRILNSLIKKKKDAGCIKVSACNK